MATDSNYKFPTESEILKYYEKKLGMELPPASMSGWSNFTCPIHGGDGVNFGINLDTGAFNCFSNCGCGSVYDFEMKLAECEFAEAYAYVWAVIHDTENEFEETYEAKVTSKHKPQTLPQQKTPAPNNTVTKAGGAVREDIYYYTNPLGQPVYAIERWRNVDGSKFFTPIHNKKGKLVEKLPSVTYPYHVGSVIRADTIIIVEGEKCVEYVRNILRGEFPNLAVTTNPGGAATAKNDKKWREEYNPYFKGKKVYLFPDNDDAGRKHIHTVARNLKHFAESLWVVEVPGDEGTDIVDFLDEYQSKEEQLNILAELLQEAKPYRSPSRAKIISFADIASKESDFVWFPYIPAGNLTMMSAEPGTGKTTVCCAIAANITNGTPFVLGNNLYFKQGNVIYLTAEDSYEQTIRPRFIAAGGDVTRMFGIDGKLKGEEGQEKELPISLQDVDELEDAIIQIKPRLIIVDPIQAYLGEDVNMNLASDVRPVLAGLKRLAEKYNVGVICIRHLSKDTKRLAAHRGLGTIDFNAACRSEVFLGKHPDDPEQRAMVHIKHNLTAQGESVGYRISSDENQKMLFEWTGKSDITEDMVAESKKADAGKFEEAIQFLKNQLYAGPVDATIIKNTAKENGISESTLKRAKGKLNVKSNAVDASKNKWNWSL
jgi:hypothetical protein